MARYLEGFEVGTRISSVRRVKIGCRKRIWAVIGHLFYVAARHLATSCKGAQGYGTKILFNAEVTGVNVETNTVYLKDGRSFAADLIIGADGLRSAVRTSIPAIASVELNPLHEKACRCSVDKPTTGSSPNLAWLLESHTSQVWSMPSKYILAWPMLSHKPYDVVVCVVDGCDVPYGYWGIEADPKQVADEFGDACPTVKDLLANIGPCTQWRFSELPPLSTCRSERVEWYFSATLGMRCSLMPPLPVHTRLKTVQFWVNASPGLGRTTGRLQMRQERMKPFEK